MAAISGRKPLQASQWKTQAEDESQAKEAELSNRSTSSKWSWSGWSTSILAV
jgi:hypothetical protein